MREHTTTKYDGDNDTFMREAGNNKRGVIPPPARSGRGHALAVHEHLDARLDVDVAGSELGTSEVQGT